MSENWQAGDMALCVTLGPSPDDWNDDAGGPAVGSIHEVQDIDWMDIEPRDDFVFPEGVWLKFAPWDQWFFHAGFRKVTPRASDEFDREVIELLRGAPATVPA